VAQFKRGDFSTRDAPRPGRPKTVTTPEIIVQNHELMLEDHRVSAKSVAEQLAIARDERVGSIIHEDLDMRKLSAQIFSLMYFDRKFCHCRCFLSTYAAYFVLGAEMVAF